MTIMDRNVRLSGNPRGRRQNLQQGLQQGLPPPPLLMVRALLSFLLMTSFSSLLGNVMSSVDVVSSVDNVGSIDSVGSGTLLIVVVADWKSSFMGLHRTFR